MFQYNYGGIQAKTPTGPADNVADRSQVDIVSSWNIAEYLPKATQVSFHREMYTCIARKI